MIVIDRFAPKSCDHNACTADEGGEGDSAQRESVSRSDSNPQTPASKEFFDREFTVITPFCLNDSAL